MLKVDFKPYREISEVNVKYAVVIARFHDNFVFVKHRERTTWEIPGGHIEPGESAYEAAERELSEETSAVSFSIIPVALYSVSREGVTTYGGLFFADIVSFSESLLFETSELSFQSNLPDNLTYPEIQPHLFGFVLDFLEGNNQF